MIGKLLDQRYKVTESLSSGAFGQTFLAEDTKRPQNPLCVIKKLKPKQSQPECLLKATELFKREAEALERLGQYPQIPTLLAHLEIEGEFYLVEEYIRGQTLEEELAAKNHFPEPEVLEITTELLEILNFIHKNNIIHRDIKPSNIIRNQQDNKLALIDFGAVMEFQGKTFLGTAIGTPGYTAPEQSLGKTGFYSDIYAVGIIGIQSLSGVHPCLFSHDDNEEIILPDHVSVNPKLRIILTKMVRHNKSDRYHTAGEVLQDLAKLEKVSMISKSNNSDSQVQAWDGLVKKKFFGPALIGITCIPFILWLILSKNSKSLGNLSLPTNGKLIAAELDSTNLCQDTLLEPEIYCQKYSLQGRKDQEVSIEMNSDDFDPFLVLQSPNGDKLELNSDRSPQNWNAQIKTKLPIDGKYRVITRTTSPGESGTYTIRARLNSETP